MHSSGQVDLLRGSTVEFKSTMVRPRDNGPQEVIWEDQNNRVIDVPDTGGSTCNHIVQYDFSDFTAGQF